ncbi:MAG: EVE domain-containing protein [Pseudomonadota bacterium]|nr:EVE domain-containing protein [Pseudomonadota bacterium]
MRYWLMKCEPDVYSIDDLKRERVAMWEGVRNYQARNFMRDDMKKGDLVLFYHSNAKPPGVAGTAVVAKTAYPDPTAFDPQSPYYDAKSTPAEPRWLCVDVKFTSKFPKLVSLTALKNTHVLKNMMVVQKGSRLSVQPCTAKEYQTILALAGVGKFL